MKEIVKRIENATTGKDVRSAITDGFNKVDEFQKKTMTLLAVQGVAIIILNLAVAMLKK